MRSLERRATLRHLGAALVAGSIAGCSTLRETPAPPTLASLSIKNDSDEHQRVRLTITDDGVTELFESYDLGTDHETGVVHLDPPVEEPGRYRVQVTTDDDIAAVEVDDVADEENPCVGLTFRFDTVGTLRWSGKAWQEC